MTMNPQSQNGRDYSYVLANAGLDSLQQAAFDLSVTLDADGSPAQASRIRQAFFRLLNEFEEIGRDIAVKAEEAIVQARQAGEVRGSPGVGGHLDDHIGKSAHLVAVEGSVGINNEEFLDSGPMYWWRAVDLGYDWSAHEGVDIKGFFMPGRVKPDAGQFRAQTSFRAAGRGPRMTPANAIEPQEFVERGYQAVAGKWRTRVKAAEARFVREVDAALAAAPPSALRKKGRRRP